MPNLRTYIYLLPVVMVGALAFGADSQVDQEVRIALSAAPEHLRAGAGVFALSENRFRKVREASNGFNCLVVRSGDARAPMCFDAEGSRTTLLVHLREQELRSNGLDEKLVQETISAEYESGALSAPEKPGIAYMLSREFVRIDPETGVSINVFPPHLMFYAPYKTNADIGADPEHIGSFIHPWILSPGTPGAYIIVVPAGESSEKATMLDENSGGR